MNFKIYNWLPFLFLIGMAMLTCYLFFILDILPENEKRVTGIFTILTLTFGVFQFWLSEINNKKKRDFNLRYDSYKEFRVVLDSITEILNEDMGQDSANPHSTVTKLLNLLNQFQTAVKIDSEFLFKGLKDKKSAKTVRENIDKILVRTDQFRKQIDDLRKRGPETVLVPIAASIEQMNWHNETRELLADLHNNKYSFYKTVLEYL